MPDSPEYSAYGQRSGRTSKERAAEQAASPGGDTEALAARIAALEAILQNMQGANGIDVNLPVISFDAAAAKAGNAVDADDASDTAVVLFDAYRNYAGTFRIVQGCHANGPIIDA